MTIVARREVLLEKTAERCRNYCSPDDVLVVPADVSDKESCRTVVTKTIERFKKLDVVILNAALSQTGLFTDSTDPGPIMMRHMEVNLMQCVYLTQFSLPHLRESTKRGIIVPISSMAGLLGTYGCAPYSASKHAIHGFFDSLRPEIKTDVDIVMFPLPYVNTATAVNNLHPKDPNYGMPSTECAMRIARTIPSRPRQHFMTTEIHVGFYLGVLFPGLMEKLAMSFLQKNFQLKWVS